MTDGKRIKNRRLYLAVDIGGTKIQSSLVEESGAILARERVRTPREGGSAEVLAALESAMQQVLSDPAVRPNGIAGIGVAVPGVVEPRAGRVVVTPNMNLTGVDLGPHLEDRFRVPVAIGNDCNLGTLGEAWLGSARNAASVVGMFVGTGLGGGFVRKGKLWRGAREAAMEVGHTVMQIGGRLCGCGNKGCLEAVASRSAIERDIREGVAQGRPTALNEMLAGDLGQIRSGTLRKALEQGDELVTEVVHRAADVLGHACLTIRHILDPEVIVLGGGVVEACHAYILPIVEGIVAGDKLPGARDAGHVVLSALGDDAVVLGAAALAARHAGRNPFKKKYRFAPSYPAVVWTRQGEVLVANQTYTDDVYVRVDGKIKRRRTDGQPGCGDSHMIGAEELEKVCKGGPTVVFIGTGESGQLQLDDAARRYLQQRSIEHLALPTPQAIVAYNDSNQRKAALFHVTC